MTPKRLFYPGRKVKAICPTCKEIGMATFSYGTVPLEDGTPVEGVMRGVCDACGTLVATAPQSTPLVRAALEARDERRRAEGKERTSVRIPRVLADFARWELFELKAPDTERFDLLVKAFVMSLMGTSLRRHSDVVQKLQSLDDPVLEQPFDYTVSLNFGTQLWQYLETLRNQAGLRSTSDLVRRMFVLVQSDRKVEDELKKLVMIA